MKIKFEFKTRTVERDFITDSFELSEVYFNNLEPTDNSVRLKIPFDSFIADKLKAFKEDIKVRIVNDDNSYLFTGYLRNDFSFTKTQRNEPIQIEIISPSFLLDKDLKEPITEFKKSVNEIIKILLQKAGIENTPDTGINNILDVFIAKNEDNIKEIITNLCFEFGYVFNFDNDGLFRVYPLFDIPETQNIVQTFDGTNILDSVTMNKKEQEADNIHAEWSRIDFKENTLIFSDTQNATDADKCNIKIAANSFVFDTEENYIKYDSTLGEILCVKELTNTDIIADSGIDYSITNLGKQGLFKAKNSTGTEKLIRKFDVYGNAYIKTSSNISKSSRGNKIKKFELHYLNTKEAIESFVQKLQAYYEYADFTLTLKSKIDYAIGSFVKVFENGLGTIYARIVEKKRRYKDAYNYKLEAVSEYAPAEIKTIGSIPTSNDIPEKKSIPPIPQNINCVAYKDGIKINWDIETQGIENAIDCFIIEVKKHNNNVTLQTSNTEIFYNFNRSTDGYPEKDVLLNWKVKIKSKSIQKLESDFSEEKNINVDNYGSWTVAPPTVNNLTSDRTVILQIQEGFRSDNLKQYGNTIYKIQITRPDVDNNKWYSPSTNLNPYEAEINYKNKLNEFITTGNVYSQTLPLKGQDTNAIENTLYQFKIIATNESGNLSEAVIINATALCTSLRDIVKAKANFKEIYVPELSAISANLGSISEGSLTSNNHNYWALTDAIINNVFKKKGSFRVGDENQFIQVDYKEDGKASVSIKSGSFFLESLISEFTGDLVVFDNDNKNNRVKIMSNGIYFEEKINNIWQPRGQFILDSNGNIVITNGKNTPKLGNPITDSQTVYHFNTNINDGEGGNKENIIIEGNIISDDGPISSNCFNGDITVNLTDEKQILFFSTGGYLQVGKNKGGIIISLEDDLKKIKTPVHDYYDLYRKYYEPSQVSIRHNIIKKGTINPPQDVHTIEVMNAVEYLRNLPQNTTTNPYKVKLLYNGRNIRTYELIRNQDIRWRVKGIVDSQWAQDKYKTQRFVDLSYTDIEVDDYIRWGINDDHNFSRSLEGVFSGSQKLIKSPRFINPKQVRDLDFRRVFAFCDNLVEAYFPPNRVGDTYNTFCGCVKLQSINLTGYTDDITNEVIRYIFYDCPSLTDIYFNFEIEEKKLVFVFFKKNGGKCYIKKI